MCPGWHWALQPCWRGSQSHTWRGAQKYDQCTDDLILRTLVDAADWYGSWVALGWKKLGPIDWGEQEAPVHVL